MEISLDDLALHVHGLEEHDENDRLDAVEGTLVGLCLSPPDPPKSPECLGLGLVLAVDRSKRILYLKTPLHLDLLERVDLMVATGGLEFSQEFGEERTIPPNTSATPPLCHGSGRGCFLLYSFAKFYITQTAR